MKNGTSEKSKHGAGNLRPSRKTALPSSFIRLQTMLEKRPGFEYGVSETVRSLIGMKIQHGIIVASLGRMFPVANKNPKKDRKNKGLGSVRGPSYCGTVVRVRGPTRWGESLDSGKARSGYLHKPKRPTICLLGITHLLHSEPRKM